MFNFTLQKLIETVRELAKENPNNAYIRSVCYYNKGECTNGTVGCIFGQAMRKLGVSEDELNKFGCKPISDIFRQNHIGYDPLFFTWCEMVQQSQDSGKEWGQCVKEADEQKRIYNFN